MQLNKLQELEKQVIQKKKITTINIDQIPCHTSIGIHPEEKKLGQILLFDVCIDIDSSGIQSDHISETLSYVDVFKTVQEVSKAKSYSLIETLAEELASTLLNHSLVEEVKIKVYKPHIPYPEFKGKVSVEVKRKKS